MRHPRQSIFVVGVSRSGTSLVEQILASHPNVYGAGEMLTLMRLRNSIGTWTGALYPDNVPAASDDDLRVAGDDYVRTLRAAAPGVRFITDKLPHNFENLGLIHLILPKAKIIHCTRDPMDTCLSVFKSLFGGSHGYSRDLLTLGRYYNLYRSLMLHWHSVMPGVIHDFQYEDLVTNQIEGTRRLLDLCGLNWDDRCLSFFDNDRRVKTVSREQVRRPIYADSVGSWKRYERQLAPLREILDQGDVDISATAQRLKPFPPPSMPPRDRR